MFADKMKQKCGLLFEARNGFVLSCVEQVKQFLGLDFESNSGLAFSLIFRHRLKQSPIENAARAGSRPGANH
jgi:hypothetical protein